MKYIFAYGLVIVLVQFCLTVGSLVVGFPIALCLAWAPGRLRGVIAGTVSGVGGVAAAVAFGYCVFYLILGSGSFGIGALLAATLPLALPILNDRRHALNLAVAEGELPEAAQAEATPTTEAARYSVIGYILGLILAYVWFFLGHGNAA